MGIGLDIALWQQTSGKLPELSLNGQLSGEALDAEHSAQHAFDIAIENGSPCAISKRGNRRSR